LFDLPLYRTPVFRTRLAYRTEDGGNKHLWKVGQFLRDYTAQHPRRRSSSSINF
jgi:hypothetical protein